MPRPRETDTDSERERDSRGGLFSLDHKLISKTGSFMRNMYARFQAKLRHAPLPTRPPPAAPNDEQVLIEGDDLSRQSVERYQAWLQEEAAGANKEMQVKIERAQKREALALKAAGATMSNTSFLGDRLLPPGSALEMIPEFEAKKLGGAARCRSEAKGGRLENAMKLLEDMEREEEQLHAFLYQKARCPMSKTLSRKKREHL